MKKIALVLAILAVAWIINCGGVAVLLDAPQITNFYMDSTSVTVTWLKDTTVVNHIDFQGWNIYVYTDSSELLVENGEDLNKFNSQIITSITTASFVSYTVDGLSQDSIYYIQVRTVNIDNTVGSYNTGVPFIKASPRPEFTVTLKWELDAQGVDDSCAIRFSDAHITSDSAMGNDGADMWIGAPNDTVTLTSPGNHPWYFTARHTLFINMGQYELVDIYEITSEPAAVWACVDVGDLVVAKTEDGNYVKIHIDAINTNDNRVTITYAYQNVSNFPYLSP